MALYQLRPYFTICILLLSALTSGLHAESGLYVRGAVLHLHGSAQLSVQGDVYLEEAEIKGSGSVVLCGALPQAVHACGSRLSRLTVANPTAVALYGELYISSVLSVQQGVLDVRAGQLYLEAGAVAEVAAGARLLGRLSAQWSPARPPVGIYLPRSPTAAALLPPVQWPVGYAMPPVRHASPTGGLSATGIALPVPHPPPQPASGNRRGIAGAPQKVNIPPLSLFV